MELFIFLDLGLLVDNTQKGELNNIAIWYALSIGMILSLSEFDKKVSIVLKKLDYKFLDKEVEFFRENISTGEIIIKYLWADLNSMFRKNMLYHLVLWETNNNYFECGRK